MKKTPIAQIEIQKGMTIISLMIGLFISMLCILASLTLYKNLIHVATEAKVDAVHDGQLSTSMLTIQKMVLSAGYGIDNADANDIAVYRTAAVGSDPLDELYEPGSIELLWRYLRNGTYECLGVMEDGVDRGTTPYRTLRLRRVAAGCDAVTALNTLNWADVATIAEWPVIGTMVNYIAANETLINFTTATTDCSPFGVSDTETHLSLTVSAPNSASLNGGATIASTAYTYCLANTYPAAAP